jgi:hypothetical protein
VSGQRTAGGCRSYDGRGIPPDIRTEVFTDEELDNGRDSALDRAIDLLNR